MNRSEIEQIEGNLQQVDLHIEHSEYKKALAMLNEDIRAIADSYCSNDTDDDTGMKLALATAEEAQGNLARAAYITRAVVGARLDMLKSKEN